MHLLALSASFVATIPGAAWGAQVATPEPGWSVGSVRIEPLAAHPGGTTVAGTGSFRGAVEVRRNGRAVAVVNHLGLEEYVRGIDEVPPSWPVAALQAQAIAARTYAAHTALSKEARWRAVGADICATATCQVYRGLDTERRAQGHGWLPAVEATAGTALLSGGQPIRASYSSTANGPRAMSQIGALAMARAGRSTGEILQSYYGVGPTPATGRLPVDIRVAVVMSTTSVRISSGGPFRVLDGAGIQIAASGVGEWRVVPAGDGVRIVPPTGHLAPAPALTMPTPAPAPVAAARLPGRVVIAAAPSPQPPWTLAAALALTAGVAAAAIGRRRLRRPG